MPRHNNAINYVHLRKHWLDYISFHFYSFYFLGKKEFVLGLIKQLENVEDLMLERNKNQNCSPVLLKSFVQLCIVKL